MTASELDKVTLVLEDGSDFSLWTSMTLSDSFLDPCQTFSLTVEIDELRWDLTKKIKAFGKCKVLVNDQPQLTGIVDSVEISADGHSGTSLQVTGRDFLSQLVKGNIDPRYTPKKSTTLMRFVEDVFKGQYGYSVKFNDSGHEALAAAIGKNFKRSKSSGSSKRKKPADPIKEAKPHDNEGAFEYVRRVCHRHGHHPWAAPDGSAVIVSSPDYDQSPAYDILSFRGSQESAANMVLRYRTKFDASEVPSVVNVRGKSGKAGEKLDYKGEAVADVVPLSYYCPFFCVDDLSNTKDHCDRVARFILSKAMRKYLNVDVTVRGLSDPKTGRVWNVDTVARTQIEAAGINGPLWVEARTLRKSRQGTFADLHLIPLNSLLFDVPPDEDPPTGVSGVGQRKKRQRDDRPWEERVAETWFSGAEGLAGATPKAGK